MQTSRRRTQDDSGMALVFVMGAMALLVILLTASFYLSSQTLFQAEKADQHDAAFQAASSGVLVAFVDLRSRLGALPAEATWTGAMPAASAAYSVAVTLNAARTSYECTSTGTAPDGTRETVVARFGVMSVSGSSLPWGNNVFYFAGYNGDKIVGNGTMTGPFYVSFPGNAGQGVLEFGSAGGGIVGGPIFVENGSLVLKSVPSAPIRVYSNGSLTLEGRAKGRSDLVIDMGWDATKRMPVTMVDVPSFLSTSLVRATAQSSDNIMGDTLVGNYEAQTAGDPAAYASAALSPPNGRPAGWLRAKAPGAGQAYKVISGGLTIGPATPSWGSWSGDGHYPTSGDVHDDFAYDAVNRVLYIEGTVYVGGDLVLDAGGSAIRYVGNGTIVCAGNVIVRSGIVPATANGSDGGPDPDPRHLLCIFTAGDLAIDGNGVSLTGAVYVVGEVSVSGNNDTLKGSFVAERGLGALGNGTRITAFTPIGDFASPGLPSWGSAGTDSSSLVMDDWRRL